MIRPHGISIQWNIFLTRQMKPLSSSEEWTSENLILFSLRNPNSKALIPLILHSIKITDKNSMVFKAPGGGKS